MGLIVFILSRVPCIGALFLSINAACSFLFLQRLTIVEFAFGDVYCREGLDLQEREMITLATLLTLGGCETQLEVHLHGALNVGVTPQKIIETFLQCIPYTGFPRVLNAVAVAKRIFEQRQVSLEAKEN